jgi:ankyrin repeat protein
VDEEEKDLEELSEVDRNLYESVTRNDTVGARHALRSGANVNCVCNEDYDTPLAKACERGYDHIVRILLDAGADPWWIHCQGRLSIIVACERGHSSTVEILINYDVDLLEILDQKTGLAPLLVALEYSQYTVAHLLLDRRAHALVTTQDGKTTLMSACQNGNPDIVRRLLATGVPVEARDNLHCTALHYAAESGRLSVMRLLIVDHNANIFAADKHGDTPYDSVSPFISPRGKCAFLIECYGNTLTQEYGQLTLQAVLRAAKYSFLEDYDFHPPLTPLRIRLPLGYLTLQHFRTLLHSLDIELLRSREESGKLLIHIACQANAPVEVLSVLTEMDPTTLQIADYSGALPIHSLFYSGTRTEYTSLRYLVEQGGVGTLAARHCNGVLPLHVLCESTYPSLRIVQYLIQSFPGSVAVQTNSGHYPFMIAAGKSSTATFSVLYELVRANPDLVVPR